MLLCYRKNLIIKVEVPGKGAELKTKVQNENDYYIFYFEGIKPCEKSIIGQQLKISKNLKDQIEYKFNIYIPISEIRVINKNFKTWIYFIIFSLDFQSDSNRFQNFH